MDLGLSGKVAMVAAASKGLGRAAALALAREGCSVSVCGRTPGTLAAVLGDLEAAAPGRRHAALPCDVSLPGDLERWHARTRAELGPVDILVTNTGGPPAAGFEELTEAQWAEGVQSTLMNAVRLCRLVLPDMRARRWGRIVHITSLVARQPSPQLTISSTLRAGLSALTRTLAQETGRDGITVNALLPGHVLTDRQRHLGGLRCAQEGITMDDYFARTAASIPAGRLGEPEEIGDAVAFLCSERAAYITGSSIPVDGGIILGTF